MQTIEQIQNFRGKYPKQLWYLFFSEMWERFCFYGMRGMLTIFMIDKVAGLGMNNTIANLQYGATQAFVYAFTFIGGLFADKILGFRKSLFWGGFLMILGSCILAINPSKLFYVGIAFTIVGTGFFKPNISSMVGQLYKQGDERTDAGFSLFYAGINLGALLGGYLCVAIAKGNLLEENIEETLRWNVAFGLAAIVMSISLITFLFTQKTLATIGLQPVDIKSSSTKKQYEYLTYFGSLAIIPIIMMMVSKTEYTDIFMYTIGPITILYLLYEILKLDQVSRNKMYAALVFVFFSVWFWAFFEQSGGSLSLFAESNLSNKIFNISFDPNGVNNSANSLFVIMFAAMLGLVWIWLSKMKLEPNSIIKFGIAFLFLALGFYIFYFTKTFSNEQGVTSLGWFTFGWFILTFGELCLSPIGMSLMTKLSPQNLQGIMMGVWFLASAYGQYIAGILGAKIANNADNLSNKQALEVYCVGYKQLSVYAIFFGVIILAISPIVKKWMQGLK